VDSKPILALSGKGAGGASAVSTMGLNVGVWGLFRRTALALCNIIIAFDNGAY